MNEHTAIRKAHDAGIPPFGADSGECPESTWHQRFAALKGDRIIRTLDERLSLDNFSR